MSGHVCANDFWPVCSHVVAEASCVSQILTARAVASELGAAKSKQSGVSKWARINVGNSERDVQRVAKKQGLKLNVPVEDVSVGSTKLCWINPKAWLKFILDNRLWCHLCGLSWEQEALCRPTWLQFWKNFRKISPSHEVFSIPGIDLSRTAAMYVHGDEGRGLKRCPFMVTNLQSAVGHGSEPQNRKCWNRCTDGPVRLMLNHLACTFLTRFITILMPKTLYENPETSDLYLAMLDKLGAALDELLTTGMEDSVGNTHRICVIGVKGDLPYLAKVSTSERVFNRAGRGGKDGHMPGICHLCLAGTKNVEAEQAGVVQPKWLQTEGTVIPWSETPPLSRWLCAESNDLAALYKVDIWHTFHLGIGRSFIASSIVMLLDKFDATSADGKFAQVSANYLEYCKTHKKQPHIRKISKDFVSYNDPTGVNGYWSKGALTTVLMSWLEFVLGTFENDPQDVFYKILLATRHANNFFRCLYSSDAFLSAEQCAYASAAGRGFLSLYIELARDCFAKRRVLYPLLPKLHFMDHHVVRLHWDGVNRGLGINPLQTAVQLDEDAVGKLARISRRVSIRKNICRTFGRYLMGCHDAYRAAGWI